MLFMPGKPEVCDPDSTSPVEQNIGRLDIAVYDALIVCVTQSVGDLGRDFRDTVPIAWTGIPVENLMFLEIPFFCRVRSGLITGLSHQPGVTTAGGTLGRRAAGL